MTNLNDLQGRLSGSEMCELEAAWDRHVGVPYLSKGMVWVERFGNRHVVIEDVEGGKVWAKWQHDPTFGFWQPEAEFLREHDYCPPEDA